MRHAKIVLVAEWDGWCGACAAERPLVLTRTGRQRLRTWLTGAADDSRPLVLTCRLCGTGVHVPLERDDPPVLVSDAQDVPETCVPETSVPQDAPLVDLTTASSIVTEASAPAAATSAESVAGRETVAAALAALLAQRSADAASPQTAAVPMVAPLLPQQRTPSSGGLAELQLLADGIDLLNSGRA